MLTNITYVGRVRYKDEIHDGQHAAIVDDELWQRVQAKLQRNGRTGGGNVRNRFGALLKGLLHCVPCDSAMSPSHTTKEKTKRYRYYVCTAAQRRGRKNCPSPSLPAGEIERFVVEQIKVIGRDPQLVAETVRQMHGQATERVVALGDEEGRLERELAGHHRDLQDVVRQPGATTGNGPSTARLADLQERIAAAERRLTEVRDKRERLRRDILDEADVSRALAEFDPVWESLSPYEQGRLLHLLIERIDYDGRDGTMTITFHSAGIKTLADRDRGEAA